MNWPLLFGLLAALGVVLVLSNQHRPRAAHEPHALVQTGYLAAIIGVFGSIAQWISLPATMLVFLVVSGLIWLLDVVVLRKQREADTAPSDVVEYARNFFPVIFVVFLLRSFLLEPFQIPSSSMRPSLVVGDFVLVSKFSYGLRVPVLNTVFIPTGTPQRGDVMVFDSPSQPGTNYIKRVVGVPGDTVEYRNKHLFINGQEQPQVLIGLDSYPADNGRSASGQVEHYQEQLGSVKHSIFIDPQAPVYGLTGVKDFPYRSSCSYEESRFTCRVPAGHYFMMGDNRDNSGDSRYWGFVPDAMIVGKAFRVAVNFSAFSRIGHAVQ